MSVLYPGLTHQIGGNTAGATANISSGTYLLAGGNNITLSQNGNTITISGGAGGGGNLSVGMSTGGNTSGTTGLVQSQMVFAGGNNITLSQSVNGNSATLSISAAAVGAGSFSAGMSNIGNTLGTSGTVANQLVFAGGNNITLSQSVNGGSATLTISGGAGGGGVTQTHGFFPRQEGLPNVSLDGYSTAVKPFFLGNFLNMSDSINFIEFPASVSMSTSSNSSYAGTMTWSLGIYTQTGKSISLASSCSFSISWNNTSNDSTISYANRRMFSVSGMSWYVTPGEYWLAYQVSRSTSGANWLSISLDAEYLQGQSKQAAWETPNITVNGTHNVYWEGNYSTTTSVLPNYVVRGDLQLNFGVSSAKFRVATGSVAWT